MKTLIINTYAGSLLLGADKVDGAEIIGSYEDVGFGAEITKANRARFTRLADGFTFIDKRKDWPEQDLTDAVILAHPPCAAFSQQNTSAAKRGINTDAFECTRVVLKYGMMNGAAAIAIESVPGALRGAWDVYDHMAEAGGYHVYRILKNSILFGVPQYRDRFWAVLVRKDIAQPEMKWVCSPRFTHVKNTINHLMPGTQFENLQRTLDRFINQLGEGPCPCGASHGFDLEEVRQVGLRQIDGFQRMGFAKLITPRFFPTDEPRTVCRKHVSPFTSAQPSVLAPWGFVPVLLGSSLWVYCGKPVPAEGYKALMGFPVDYVFPPSSHGMRTMLSKGVCPPVATWILDNIFNHLGVQHQRTEFTRENAGYVISITPGQVASFKPSRKLILERYAEMMMLEAPESDELIPLEEGRDYTRENESRGSDPEAEIPESDD